jgi:hypothetical protein
VAHLLLVARPPTNRKGNTVNFRISIACLLSSFAVALSGCGVDTSEELQGETISEDMIDSGSAELSTTKDTYVSVRRDYRKCMYPMCGGYYVRDVNSSSTTWYYVFDIDRSQSNIDDETWGTVHEGIEQQAVVLKGRLSKKDPNGYRQLIAKEAYRGLPGVETSGAFYSVEDEGIVCITAPCNSLKSTKLNRLTEKSFTGISVDDAASKPLVQKDWLINQVLHHGALVAGRFVTGKQMPGGREIILDAKQVYFKLPADEQPCPMFALLACENGTVQTWYRNEERCLMPLECSEPVFCTMMIPACADGYVLRTWRAGCAGWACDPAFMPETMNY